MLTPIFLPLALELGLDPVHFGLIFIITITIGNFTPPVGSAMYAVCSILDCPINDYTLESIPFFMTVALVAALLVFVPDVVLFIPDLIFGKA
jgi:TRAP-type C4-dicarboxylate transport system permease large subunit